MDEILGLDVRSGVSRTVKGSRELDKNWKADGIQKLREWMDKSKDYSKTIETWAAVYIRCGACYRGFQEWVKENPIAEGWTERAIETIEKNRWI
jgi:hypothetical protein